MDGGEGLPDLEKAISEEWLKEVGFLWSQYDRQPSKHWTLWLGDAVAESNGQSLTCTDDIGIEVAEVSNGPQAGGAWFCWMRSDMGSRYGRFIHVRHLFTRLDIVRLVEAMTGFPWAPERHVGGICRGPKGFANFERWAVRADVQSTFSRLDAGWHWHDHERDPHMARATAQTMTDFVKMKNER